MRSTWTNERLDYLKDEVVEVKHEVGRVKDELARQGARIDAMGERIDALSQTILMVGGRLFAGSIALTIAMVGLIATQL